MAPRRARRSAVSAGTWRARRPEATRATHDGPVRAVRSCAARFAVGTPHIVVPSTARMCDAGSPALTVRNVHSTAAVRQRCVARQCLRIRACRAPTLGHTSIVSAGVHHSSRANTMCKTLATATHINPKKQPAEWYLRQTVAHPHEHGVRAGPALATTAALTAVVARRVAG